MKIEVTTNEHNEIVLTYRCEKMTVTKTIGSDGYDRIHIDYPESEYPEGRSEEWLSFFIPARYTNLV